MAEQIEPVEFLSRADDLRETASAGMEDAPNSPQALDEALDVLRRALAELSAREKHPAAAGVKSEMGRLTAGGFNQSALGFPTFRAFLHEAARRGVVDLIMPEPGSRLDILLALPGHTVTPPPRQPPSTSAGKRIREDLWRAFIDWSPGWTRAWDARAQRAVVFPTDARPLEPTTYRDLREAWKSDPSRFHIVSPLGEERQLEWMQRFVAELGDDDAARSVLEESLRSARPISTFAASVRALPSVSSRWKDFRYGQVLSAISSWIDANGISVDPEESRPRRTTSTGSAKSTRMNLARPQDYDSRDAVDDATIEGMRQAILRAVGRMPLYELLRLPIPAEYVLQK